MNEIRVGWMYPDLLNLHGERGSIQALQRIGENLGIHVDIQKINDFDEEICFQELDAMIFLPGEISAFYWLKPALEKQRQGLDAFLERGGYLLAMGTTGLLFGQAVQREDGSVFEGLGYLKLKARERKYVWGDDLHFRLNGNKQEIFGHQILMADVETEQPLGTTLYGYGNNHKGAEGARYHNLIYTNCLGPLFVKNPWWAEDILKDIYLQKYCHIQQRKNYEIASHSFEAGLRFVAQKPSK